jgi:hypothetical protein
VAWSHLHEGVTPTSVSRMLTQSISTYWVHPHLFVHSYDGGTLSWILLSPIAVAMTATGLVRLGCAVDELAPGDRLRPAPGLLKLLFLAPTLLVSAWWVAGSQHYGSPILRAGTLDDALIAAMAVSLVVLATDRARTALEG